MNNIDILEEYLDKQDRKYVSKHRFMILNAIETLIAENKELKEENKCLKNKELDYMTVYLNGVYDGEKKVDDKIKAKIEEYEEQEKDEPNAFLCKRVLQSLLEKE